MRSPDLFETKRARLGGVSRRRRERGFTLVELMVVIVIMGILASAVVMVMPAGGSDLRREGERFAARAKAAQEAALIDSRSTSVRLDASGYTVSRSQGGAWQDVASFPWSPGTAPDIAPGAHGRTVFDATGFADPLEITLRRDQERLRIRIDSDGAILVRR